MFNLGIPIIIGTVGVIEINHKDDHTRIASPVIDSCSYLNSRNFKVLPH